MKTPHEMIITMFQRSVFALTFETDDILGYRSGPQGEVLRALSIDLKRRTVEYELTQRGLPTKPSRAFTQPGAPGRKTASHG